MSRQNKNIKMRLLAKQITALHLRGERGPTKTTPKHTKALDKRTYTTKTRGTKDMQRKPKHVG